MSLAAPFPTMRSTYPRSGRSQLRLTTRGRALILLLTVLALFTVVVASGRITAEATTTQTGPAAAIVVVQPGESLWSIAQQVAPNTDPRETVSRIRDLNGLGDAVVTPGQSLVVPVVN